MRWLSLSMACAAALATPSQAGGPDDQRHYAVASQPLTQALAQFARESGVDLIYEGGLMAGLRSAAIDGGYTAPAALRALLEGTGLTARYTDRKAAIVYRPDRPPPTIASGAAGAPALRLDKARVHAPLLIGVADTAMLDAYGRGAQAEIRAALQEDPVIAQRQFSIEMTMQIDRAGRMNAVALVRGTGDTECDDRITNRLDGRILSRPPPNGLRDALRFQVTSARLARRD